MCGRVGMVRTDTEGIMLAKRVRTEGGPRVWIVMW